MQRVMLKATRRLASTPPITNTFAVPFSSLCPEYRIPTLHTKRAPLACSTPSVALRGFHSTPQSHNMMLVATGAGIAVAALAARYILTVVDTKKKVDELTNPDSGKPSADSDSESLKEKSAATNASKKPSAPASTGGFFSAQNMARRFYVGGFEDKMTRREAALILGVRCVFTQKIGIV